MVDIKKYYLFCMGEAYLDKRRYQDELGQEKMQNRVMRDHLEQAMRAATQPSLTAPRPGLQQQPVLNPFMAPPTFFQRVMQSVTRPLQGALQFLRNLFRPNANRPQASPQQQVMKGPVLEQIIGQVLGFFFGSKKDKLDEKKQRELEDYNDPEIWSRRMVEETSGSGFSNQH
jgi:hypothetical protein